MPVSKSIARPDRCRLHRNRAACVAALLLGACAARAQTHAKHARLTYCNPIDLNYRFRLEAPSRREAADPTAMFYRGEYWLFPSKSGGYWRSRDLVHWTFIAAHGYDVEDYAPTVFELDGRVYLMSGASHKLSVADDLAAGMWHEAADLGQRYGDPALFRDDDGRVYLYYGLSPDEPLHVAELDPHHGFRQVRVADIPASRDTAHRGYEVRGNSNELIGEKSYIEGAWMTKRHGRYYLQYATPGTEFRTYADGVLSADSPMGPFRLEPNSPFSVKPTGFITGAGHSSTFEDADGRYWHVASMTIAQRHRFERRLGLFPTMFTREGRLVADTYLGDYPHFVDGRREPTGWMLLSRAKKVTASSALEGHAPELAADENIRTWWSATSGDPGEWFQIDLGAVKTIRAVQINFADEGADALGRSDEPYLYRLQFSRDGRTWTDAIDHSRTGAPSPHDYEALPAPAQARYVRLENVRSPNHAKFSLFDLRVFGNGRGAAPAKVEGIEAKRDPADPRRVTVSWKAARGSEFYIVRLGNTPDTMNQSYQVYDGTTTLEARSLVADVPYSIAVDAVNENGIAHGGVAAHLP